MIDWEKAIKGLEHCYFGGSGTCYEKECPYYQSHDCTDELKNDILVLLKEQEKIVRCKDCRNGAYIVERDRLPFIRCAGVDHELDWFCADGKR